MSESRDFSNTLEQRHRLKLLNYLLVSVMLACFSTILGAVVETIVPGWNMTGIPWIAIVIAMECLVRRNAEAQSSRVLHHIGLGVLGEIVLISLGIKLYSMLLSGLSGFWQEVTSWQQDFLTNFFDLAVGLRLFIVSLVWLSSWLFSRPLNQLEEDEELMAQEKLGFTFTDRQDARRTLITLLFIFGGIMIAGTMAIKSSIPFLPESPRSVNQLLFALLLYFTCGFLFMALNQYAIMKARWYFNDIRVNPALAGRWILYSLFFVISVLVLVIFLPTDFIEDLEPVGGFLTNLLLGLISIVQFLIIAPISLLIALLSALFKGEPIREEIAESLPQITPQISQSAAPLPWWELVRTLLFWGIFLGTIVLSIRYYVEHKEGLKGFFSRTKFLLWFRDVWGWLRNGLRQMGKTASDTIQKGLQRARQFIKKTRKTLPSLTDLLRRAAPRQAIILMYINWIQINTEHDIRRQGAQTPLEYAAALKHTLPEWENEINSLTQIFIKARYSREPIEPTLVTTAQSSLASLRQALKTQPGQPASQV